MSIQTEKPRIANPASVLPEAMTGIQSLIAAGKSANLPQSTLDLVHLRASQINGCNVCLHSGLAKAKDAGLTADQIAAISTWRDSTCFSEAERAALALAESVTRLSDQQDAVPDSIWNDAAKHYNETQLAALVLWISLTNVFNRFNVSTRQLPGDW